MVGVAISRRRPLAVRARLRPDRDVSRDRSSESAGMNRPRSGARILTRDDGGPRIEISTERVCVLVSDWWEGRRGGGWREGSPGWGAPRGRAALVFLHLNQQRNSGLGSPYLFGRMFPWSATKLGGVQKACKSAHLHSN